MTKPRAATPEDLKRLMRPKRRKYRNVPTVIDGVRFDSKAEARRYGELRLLEKAGYVHKLKLQPKYDLHAGIKYVADFEYVLLLRDGTWWYVVEDVKGVQTAAFKLKAKMFKEKYGFAITLVR